jgi:hypothetical protein
MSDTFTIFNEVIADLADDELDWLAETEQLLYESSDWPSWARAAISVDPEDILYPLVDIDRPHHRVRIYSDDNASPVAVVPLVQGFLRRFYPGSSFSLSWASGSTRPGPGELGGGALLITADAVSRIDTWSWIERHGRDLINAAASTADVAA